MRAPKTCNAKGCTQPTHDPSGKCETHRAEYRSAHRKPDNRPSAAARGYDKTWKRFRLQYLRSNPTCVRCGAAATDLDHIDGQGPLGPHGYSDHNLQPLCHPCHSRKTAAHDGSFGRTGTRKTA